MQAQCVGRLCDIRTDLFGGLHQAAPGIEGCFFAFRWVQRIQFCNRVPQEIFFGARFGDLCLCCRQVSFCGGQRAPTAAGLVQSRIQPRIAVQHLAVTARIEQTTIIMLAVQFHQCL